MSSVNKVVADVGMTGVKSTFLAGEKLYIYLKNKNKMIKIRNIQQDKTQSFILNLNF